MSYSTMASLPRLHVPSLLLLLLSLLYTSINTRPANPSNPACPSFDFGNGITISYPFWQNNQQFEYCGYPGFAVLSAGQNPALCLADNLYGIKKINYSEKSLSLTYLGVNEDMCPRPLHDVTLSPSSLLNYTAENKMLRFFYNCTLYPPSLPSIACLQFGDKHSYVFMVGAIPEFDWHRYCESVVTVPVIKTAVGGGLLANDFGAALQDGFKLTWQPDGACQSCEATDGFCGYSNGPHQNFFFSCSDGRHSNGSRSNDVVSNKLEPSFVAMGAIIFGGLIIAATVFYFAQRKKVASYKPVFRQIPSSGK